MMAAACRKNAPCSSFDVSMPWSRTTSSAAFAPISSAALTADAEVEPRAPSDATTTTSPASIDPSALANAIGMYQSGEHKLSEITAATGISRSTLYRNLPKGGDGDG